jgi:hypothetical protein
MDTLESAIAEARTPGTPLHTALSNLVGTRASAWTRHELFSLINPHVYCTVKNLLDAVLAIREGVYQWRKPVPAAETREQYDARTGTTRHTYVPAVIAEPEPEPGACGHTCGAFDCVLEKGHDEHVALGDVARWRSTAPEVPGDGDTEVYTRSPAVVRGLRLLGRHLTEGGHDWRNGTDAADVQAAQAWLACPSARTVPVEPDWNKVSKHHPPRCPAAYAAWETLCDLPALDFSVGDVIDDVDLELIERWAGGAYRAATASCETPPAQPSAPPADPGSAEWRRVSDDTAFAPPFGTIRSCIGCGCLVSGGPTACARCAAAPDSTDDVRTVVLRIPLDLSDDVVVALSRQASGYRSEEKVNAEDRLVFLRDSERLDALAEQLSEVAADAWKAGR